MPINIQIKDTHVQPLIEFYGSRLEAVRKQQKILGAEEKEYEEIIAQLSKTETREAAQGTVLSEPAPVYLNVNGYQADWTIHKKIEFVLKKKGRPLTSRDIVEEILILEPGLNADKDKVAKNVSTLLSIKNGILFERFNANGGKENFYKLIEKAAV